MGALCEGVITFDQLRAVADVATPETECELLDTARQCSVRQLADVARAKQGATGPSRSDRRSLRFNDSCCTVAVQLPPESYAETRTCLEACARELPSDGETRWDQRPCDAFLLTICSSYRPGDSGSRAFVVVHVPLETLMDESSELPGELERDGFVSAERVSQTRSSSSILMALPRRIL